ncbi:MAG TPA: carboxypeptidase-like regulatory domain-containing protein [Thermoanaerobaculia bacterium]|nr:carboxypeptidase-like regulatory domain-containing protein [Thermoanaerobaculia bacterium]
MKQRNRMLSTVLSALVLILFSLTAAAQDFRGAISGTVTDASGGVLPGVTVTITNVETNVSNDTVTDEKGSFSVRYLNAGTYNVQAQLEGLQTVQRRNVTVRVGDNVPVDFKMEPGAVSEVMVVTASAPLIDTTTAVTGQVIDSNQIQQLPLGDGTAYMLTRLAPGVADSSDLHFSRPADNGNLSGIVANGALGGNDFTLDGAPNRVSPNNTNPGNNSGVVGFSPPSDAISQFKVQTNAFDAQSGHTAGATVNLALRSGTNDWRGTMAYYNRSDSRAATPLLSERAGAEKPTRQYDRYSGTLSGPVFRDRTFFMVAFERLRDIQPEASSYTVPTMKMRQGDLSEWLGVSGGATIYDPLTATGTNLARTAFQGNIIPSNRINPIARAYANLYPEPNRPGLEDNYFTNQLRPYDYNSFLVRGDHNFSGSHKLFLNAYWNKREEDRYNWAKGAANATGEGEIGGVLVTQGFDYRTNTGATLGYTALFNNSLALDVIGGWSQFGEWRDPAGEIDPASLGFSPQVVALMNGYQYLPFITFGGFSSTNANSRIATLGSQRSDFGAGFDRPFTNISLTPTASWLMGNHSFKTGYELRHQRWQIDNAEYGAGRFFFNGAYTRANNSAALNHPAQSWAQFLLGLPTTATNTVAAASTASQFEIAADADYRQVSHSLFMQDDWSLTQRLTLNLGARFEFHQAMMESEDRNIAGFNQELESPIAAQARARYAANPMPEIAADAFRVNGGLEFADGALYDNLFKFLPRAAASYLINDRTVIRGGIGLFSYDYYFDAGNQLGFSQPTPIVSTQDNGRTFIADLSNPIPSGQLIQPTGSALGAATNLGLNVGTVVPSERKVPYYTRWQIGGQRDLGRGWVVEAFYVNSKGRNLPVLREINGIPLQYLSTSTQRDTEREAYLSANVPNPFQGLIPGNAAFNGANITRGQLLRPFPQFQSIVTEEYAGSDSYQAGSLRVEKRFSSGNSLLATYTRSESRDKLNYLNPSDTELEDRVSPNDRPHRATLGATLRLPFGRERRYGQNWNFITDAILGGWTVSATYQYQTGAPLVWNNNIYYDPSRDPNDLRAHIGGNCPDGGTAGLDCAAWDTGGFYIPGGTGRSDPRINMGNTVRRFPSTLEHVRTDDVRLVDIGIYKSFGLPYDMDLQVRAEVINALNYTVLWNPNLDPTNANFGIVNQDRNNPRDIQLGLKLTF